MPVIPLPLPRSKSVEELIGTCQWIKNRFDDGTIIAVIRDGNATTHTVKGNPGDSISIDQGGYYRFFGRKTTHPKWGDQFTFTSVCRDHPQTEEGVTKYLYKHVEGVGAARSLLLWEKYGPAAVTVLADEPLRVVKDGLMSAEVARRVSEQLQGMRKTRETTMELYDLFANYGFWEKLVGWSIDKWGVRAPEKIRSDPYILLRERAPGCGFRKVDNFYLALGQDPGAIERQAMCLWYVIRTDNNGHTWFRLCDCLEKLEKLIGGTKIKPTEAIQEAITMGLVVAWQDKWDVKSQVGWLAVREHAQAEATVAREIKRLNSHDVVLWPRDDPDEFKSGDEEIQDPSAHQIEQLLAATATPVGMLIGSPGTGKTTTAAALIRILEGQAGRVALACPTGKAAVRLTQGVRKNKVGLSATTIHRLLKIVPMKGSWAFEYNFGNKLPYQFIIIDEFSMTNIGLLASLLSACADGTHILFVGDKHQLPPVEHGAPLRDMMEAGLSQGELTEIQRNAGAIVKACVAIKQGRQIVTYAKHEPSKGENLLYFPAANSEEAIDKLKRILLALSKSRKVQPNYDVVNDVQVLVAVNKKSPLGRAALNDLLQNELNPDGRWAENCPYRVGDKIICLKNSVVRLYHLVHKFGENADSAEMNSYRPLTVEGPDGKDLPCEDFLANGEIGTVRAVAPGRVIAEFSSGGSGPRFIHVVCGKAGSGEKANSETVYPDRQEEDEKEPEPNFSLAYAVTTHRFQGSELRVIIVMIDEYPAAKMICDRLWHYTAISRGVELVILIGRLSTLYKHCERESISERKTKLVQLLTTSVEGVGPGPAAPADTPTVPTPPVASKPTTPKPPPAKKPTIPAEVIDSANEAVDWEEWLETIDSAIEDASNLPERAEDFAASVTEKLEDIRAWVEENEMITENQRQAVENIAAGISRWQR